MKQREEERDERSGVRRGRGEEGRGSKWSSKRRRGRGGAEDEGQTGNVLRSENS